MSWIAHGGRSVGKTGKVGARGGGGGGSNSDEDGGGGGGGGGGFGGNTFRGVPLCGAAMCSGKGMPPRQLPQPGIDCVNRDRPCLPCDIVNLRLRASVAGVRVKREVAEAQKRYFCRVWNIVFSWVFPDHKPHRCQNLKSGDAEVRCRSKSGSGNRRQQQRTGRRLPQHRGADPNYSTARGSPGWRKRARLQLDDSGRPVHRGPDRGLRYNIWDIPMPDASKGGENHHGNG